MSKTIVFCADGTWNGPGRDDESDKSTCSNVFKLFSNLDGKDSAADLRHANEQERPCTLDGALVQISKYLHGVGDSDNYLVKLLGGTLGAGLITRVIRGYTFVSRNFQPGDCIILIGFSRGAYTARSLAAMIGAKGLLDAAKQDLTDKIAAYQNAAAVWYAYRKEAMTQAGTQDLLARFEQTVVELPGFFLGAATAPRIADVPVDTVAVWDTVGALGIPEYAQDEDERIDALQFCNSTLNARVSRGLHAVSLDERRVDFTPTLWDPDPARIVQVLFPGAHADVGGGYPPDESGLSDCALRWMTQKLTALGVRFADAPSYPVDPKPDATAHEPWSYPPFNLTPQAARKFGAGIAIHQSVIDRRNAKAVTSDPGGTPASYAPTNLPAGAPVVD
jgi:uncharacterized protein (DUF2235 family)